MATLKIKGLKKLERRLRENATLNDVRRAVRQNGTELQEQIQTNADFKMGYQTGATKESVGLELTDGGFTAESGPTTHYAPYLEWGTRYMDAQPFVKPAYDSQKGKFKSDMQKLVR